LNIVLLHGRVSATASQLRRPVLARFDASPVASRQLVPDAGCYVLESSYFEPNWQRAFWGRNYPRLRAVKRKYDPDGLFSSSTTGWEARSGARTG